MKISAIKSFITAATMALAGYLGWQYLPVSLPAQWTPEEVALLQSLSLSALQAAPADAGNQYAEDPRAAILGQHLFFDTRLSATGTVSCASCHRPELAFTDGLPLGNGIAVGDRHTMGLIGVAYSPWHYWDGRKDSLWSQALEPLENPLEHGSNRMDLVRLISIDSFYRSRFEDLLGPLPPVADRERFRPGASPLGSQQQREAWEAMQADDQAQVSRLFSSIGKMLAAYERQLVPQRTAFDDYADNLSEDPRLVQEAGLSRSQVAGLRLFIGKAGCLNCHNGPLFSNHDFHNTGLLPVPGLLPSLGRAAGLEAVMLDEFNCLGPFSDAAPQDCTELRFARYGDENLGAMKTPGLRDAARTAPYMHTGQLRSLSDVVRHYDDGPQAMVGHNEAEPLGLRAIERRQLVQFLHSLTSLPGQQSPWHRPPE